MLERIVMGLERVCKEDQLESYKGYKLAQMRKDREFAATVWALILGISRRVREDCNGTRASL